MANTVKITIDADAKPAETEFKKVQSSFGKLKDSVVKNSRAIGLGMTAIGGGIVGVAALSIKSFNEQQIGISKLNQSLKTVGTSYDAQKAAIERVIEAQQRKTNFGDEKQREVLTRLTGVLGDHEKALQALPTVLDAAAFSGRDAATVSETLSKFLAGLANTSDATGVSVDKTATFTERLAAVMAVAGGQAEAAADPMTQFKNRLGDVAQELGAVLIPLVEKAAVVLERVAAKVIEFSEAHPTLVKVLGIAAAAIGGLMLVIGPLLIALPAIIAGVGALGVAMTVATGPIGLIVLAIAGLVLAAKQMGAEWGEIWLVVQTIVNTAKEVVTNALNGIKEAISFIPGMTPLFNKARDSARDFGEAVGFSADELNRLSLTEIDRELAILQKNLDDTVKALEHADSVGGKFQRGFIGRFAGPSAGEAFDQITKIEEAMGDLEQRAQQLASGITTSNTTISTAFSNTTYTVVQQTNEQIDALTDVEERHLALVKKGAAARLKVLTDSLDDEFAAYSEIAGVRADLLTDAEERHLALVKKGAAARLSILTDSLDAEFAAHSEIAGVRVDLAKTTADELIAHEKDIADKMKSLTVRQLGDLQSAADQKMELLLEDSRIRLEALQLEADNMARLNQSFGNELDQLQFRLSDQGQAWQALGRSAENVLTTMVATTGKSVDSILADWKRQQQSGESLIELLLRLDKEGSLHLGLLAQAFTNLQKKATKAGEEITKALSFTPLSTGQGAAIIAEQQSALISQREAVMLQLTQTRLAGLDDPKLEARLDDINAAMLQAGRVLPKREIIRGEQVAVQRGITIPGLANGGIVRRPTLAMLGEGGPEAVVPLGSGTGMTVVVNVSGDVIGVDDLNSLILTTVRDNDLAGGGLR